MRFRGHYRPKLGLVLVLTGCGGADHFATLREDGAGEARGMRRSDEHAEDSGRAARGGGDGELVVLTEGAVSSYLARFSAIATDAQGQVVAGAEAERDSLPAGSDAAPELRLVVPEGDDYQLELTASSDEMEPSSCRASVGPLRVDAGATARVRVLSWDCGGPQGYVPSTLASECFWLADWLFVSRTRADVGQDIQVAAAGHDADGALARFEWSAPSSALGRFSEPRAARTSFRCLGRGEAQALTVAISDAACRALVSQAIACE